MTKNILKCCLSIIALFAVTGSAQAQKPIEFGVKAGVTIQNLNMNRLKLGDYSLSTDPDVGFQLGLAARINLILFHLQPEINFNFNSYNLDAREGVNGDLRTSTVKNTTIEVPVLISKKILPFLRLNAGPVFNVYNESKYNKSSNSIFKNIRTNKSSITYAAGVGLDLFSINLDLRYNGEFRRSRQNVKIGDDYSDYKTRLNFWSFSVGYFF